MIKMKSIALKEVFYLDSGKTVIAVYPNSRKESFFTKGLPDSAERKSQLVNLSEAKEFLYPTNKEVKRMIDSVINSELGELDFNS